MGVKSQISFSPLTCIYPSRGLTICPIEIYQQNPSPPSEAPSILSHETTLVTVEPNTIEDLFVHYHQTDQLLVIRGCLILVILQNRQYQYIPLSEHHPVIVKIPCGIPHSGINLTANPCTVINSIIFQGTPTERDYRPLKPPIPYDLEMVKKLLGELEASHLDNNS